MALAVRENRMKATVRLPNMDVARSNERPEV
jgi:hypothetical protein